MTKDDVLDHLGKHPLTGQEVLAKLKHCIDFGIFRDRQRCFTSAKSQYDQLSLAIAMREQAEKTEQILIRKIVELWGWEKI